MIAQGGGGRIIVIGPPPPAALEWLLTTVFQHIKAPNTQSTHTRTHIS